ncbi:MAG: acyl-protein synthetase [Gemmatimonadota bacterium]
MNPPQSFASSARGGELRDAILDVMARGVEVPLSDDEFNALALDVFRHQADTVPVYGAMVRNRAGGAAVDHWSQVPPVPTRAFREFPLVSGPVDEVEAVFRTSGTTSGMESRGQHFVRELSLYRAAILPNAQAHLNPGDERVRFLGLLPAPADRPDSSLVQMAGVLRESWGVEGSAFLASSDWDFDPGRVMDALREAAAGGQPVLLMGTAFAFVRLLDGAKGVGGAGRRVQLPPGSRVMETGGFKGRTRVVPREELYRSLSDLLGLPTHRIVNEYGMTELLSQFWETTLRSGGEPEGGVMGRHLEGPPWVRTLVLDPDRLVPLPDGEAGLLLHFDLANLHSVSAILTEDRGERRGEGFRVLGRAAGAEPRGCSLTMDELLAASSVQGSRGTGA